MDFRILYTYFIVILLWIQKAQWDKIIENSPTLASVWKMKIKIFSKQERDPEFRNPAKNRDFESLEIINSNFRPPTTKSKEPTDRKSWNTIRTNAEARGRTSVRTMTTSPASRGPLKPWERLKRDGLLTVLIRYLTTIFRIKSRRDPKPISSWLSNRFLAGMPAGRPIKKRSLISALWILAVKMWTSFTNSGTILTLGENFRIWTRKKRKRDPIGNVKLLSS